jgi:uncharacterized protein involved in exopolysaccharide biosynthesis
MTEIQKSNIHIQDDEISLKDLVLKFKEWLLFLKSKWVIIFFVGIIGGLVGFAYAYFQKPTYTATLSFALEDEKSGGVGLSGALGLASSLGIDLGTSAGGAFSGANLIELMKSRTLIEKALLNPIVVANRTYSLAEYFLDFSKKREKLNKKTELSTIHYLVDENRSSYSLQKDSLLGEIYNTIITNKLSVSQKDKKVSIINVEVKTENEKFSKVLAESLVKEVSEFYINTKSKKAKTNVAILQKQADSIRNELNAAISGVAQATDNTFNLNSALNIKRTSGTRRQVDVQANSAILTQLVTNLEMAKVTLLKETPLIQVIDKPILPLKKEKIGKLKALILGGFLASFVLIDILIIRKWLKNLFSNEKIK